MGELICNICFYVFDDCGCLVFCGVVGEFCIGGVGVVFGYCGKVEFMVVKFVNIEIDVMGVNECLFKIGDFVWMVYDGFIEFRGCRDN